MYMLSFSKNNAAVKRNKHDIRLTYLFPLLMNVVCQCIPRFTFVKDC